MIAQEGGFSGFLNSAQTAFIAAAHANALSTLAPAITVTVQDWTAIQTYVAQATNVTLYSVMGAIAASATARDATQLGPLMVALYGAVKNNLNL
jgi:hypothetical protein